MGIKLRHWNPFRHARLEREVAAIPGQRRAIKSLVESVRRQALPGESTALRAELIIIAESLRSVRARIQNAELFLRTGRADEALRELQSLVHSDELDQREAS